MTGPSFRDLDVWQLSMELADRVYDVTLRFPRYELYGLANQLRRAAASIPSNIAEGTRQPTGRSKAYYYTAANGSQAELETQLELARRRKYAPESEIQKLQDLANRVSKMLFRLASSAYDQPPKLRPNE
jgi:four helix bundle protein